MSANISRHKYKDRYVIPRRQLFNEPNSSIDETLRMIRLHRQRSDSLFSFYDNNVNDENEPITSKWTIVRQRLPDILALSTTYKPKSVRGKLVLLVSLMNKQPNQLHTSNYSDYNHNLTHVIINIGNRSRLINLKRIPSEQMIHVDIDGLSFSIPTRQFIIAISRGNAYQTATRYCPPAISDMLINLSKKKLADEGKQYKRALFKMRIGQTLFFILFSFITLMILALIISSTSTLINLNSFNYTDSNVSIKSLSSRIETKEC